MTVYYVLYDHSYDELLGCFLTCAVQAVMFVGSCFSRVHSKEWDCRVRDTIRFLFSEVTAEWFCPYGVIKSGYYNFADIMGGRLWYYFVISLMICEVKNICVFSWVNFLLLFLLFVSHWKICFFPIDT